MKALPKKLKMWICTLVACSFVILPAAAISPVAKAGPCPSGYSSQGSYCVPDRNARRVLLKNGACPSAWSSQGNHCVAGKNARKAKPKSGPCPSGWSSQGRYASPEAVQSELNQSVVSVRAVGHRQEIIALQELVAPPDRKARRVPFCMGVTGSILCYWSISWRRYPEKRRLPFWMVFAGRVLRKLGQCSEWREGCSVRKTRH